MWDVSDDDVEIIETVGEMEGVTGLPNAGRVFKFACYPMEINEPAEAGDLLCFNRKTGKLTHDDPELNA